MAREHESLLVVWAYRFPELKVTHIAKTHYEPRFVYKYESESYNQITYIRDLANINM